MGSDLAPLFAKLFLNFYESKCTNKVKKNDPVKAKNLCDIFSFIDDINSIKDGGKILKLFIVVSIPRS